MAVKGVVLPGATSSSQYHVSLGDEDETMEGDLNGDGEVSIADAVAVLEVMARDGYDAEADLNGDGEVSIADFVAVLEIMAKQ